MVKLDRGFDCLASDAYIRSPTATATTSLNRSIVLFGLLSLRQLLPLLTSRRRRSHTHAHSHAHTLGARGGCHVQRRPESLSTGNLFPDCCCSSSSMPLSSVNHRFVVFRCTQNVRPSNRRWMPAQRRLHHCRIFDSMAQRSRHL